MTTLGSITGLTHYLDAHRRGGWRARARGHEAGTLPAVAIASQFGSRSEKIGRILAERLGEESARTGGPPWMFFGPELIKRALKESNFSESLARYFPEGQSRVFMDTIEELVGLHPSTYEMRRRCHQMIVDLCRVGHVVILGRGCCVLTRSMGNTLQARLVGSLQRRVRTLSEERDMSETEARRRIRAEDAARRRYVKECFTDVDIDDPTGYDLTVNTDWLDDDTVVSMLIQALRGKWQEAR